ncbi:MAG TPA: hypothetical protein PKC97_12340 [Burkholderiaceae bacterium]|nr:hypothetical protein [Burkholderiaceae bacterium]
MQLRTARTLALCLGLASSVAALAETSPYYIGANQAFSYNSNLYSTQSNELASWYSTTSIVGGFDQSVGRQHFYGSGNFGYNYFFNNDARNLNSNSYGVNVGWDWETVERLSGTARLTANQSLVYYSIGGGQPNAQQKNIQNLSQADLTGRYGISPDIALNLGYTYRRVNFSAEQYAYEEYNQNTGSIGLTYGSHGIWTYGAAFRFQRTEYPFYPHPFPSTKLGDTGDGKNFDFTIKWVPSGLSTVDVRLSYSDINYDINNGRDFNGFNGSLTWTWNPTGKIFSGLTLIGAPGDSSTFYAFIGEPVRVDTSRFARTIRWYGTYLATGKTKFTWNLSLTKDYLEQTIFSSTQQGSDLVTTGSLGVSYAPTRNSQLACNVGYLDRSASDNALRWGMSYPYSTTTFSCSGQLVLQ